MRLLVVANSPPLSVRRVSPYCSTAPQPPGPGLPLQAPSVWIVTVLAMRNESFMSTFYRPCPPRHSEKMILRRHDHRSEEHTSELQSLMRISYAVFCLKKKNTKIINQSKE